MASVIMHVVGRWHHGTVVRVTLLFVRLSIFIGTAVLSSLSPKKVEFLEARLHKHIAAGLKLMGNKKSGGNHFESGARPLKQPQCYALLSWRMARHDLLRPPYSPDSGDPYRRFAHAPDYERHC